MTNLDWQAEILKMLLNILVALITLGLGWFVGGRLTVFWAIKQKRKELELSAANTFYDLYGEFFAIWKDWTYVHSEKETLESPEMTRLSLLNRACIAEGKLETLLVKLSSERSLTDVDVEILGKFRQSYQHLRESIIKNKDMGWHSSFNQEYVSFKRLATLTARIILIDNLRKHTGEELTAITANQWESSWILSNDDWTRLEAHYK